MSFLQSKGLLKAASITEINNLLDSWLCEPNHKLCKYELIKMEKILRDVETFMAKLNNCAFKSLEHQNDPFFFYNCQVDITEMFGVCRKIDLYLKSSFDIVDQSVNVDMTKTLQAATLKSMDTLNHVTNMSKSAEKAVCLIDLRELVLLEIEKKIAEWKTQYLDLKRCPSPFDTKAELPIKSLPDFLSSISFLSTLELFESESPLFATTEVERLFCERLGQLESQLTPMQVSVDLLTSKVADLNGSRDPFAAECARIQTDACNLSKQWLDLCSDFCCLRNQTIGARLVSVHKFLNNQVSAMIDDIITETNTGVIDREKIAPAFKRCSASITVIRKISASGMPGLQGCVHRFNLEISPRWKYLNHLLEEKQSVASPFALVFQTPKGEDNSLRTMKIARSLTPQAECFRERESSSHSRTMGIGINLHLGIKPSPSVPFSTSKDRIIDLELDTSYISKSNIQLALLQSADDNAADQDTENAKMKKAEPVDEMSSTPNTPAMFSLQSPVQFDNLATTETTPFHIDNIDEEPLDIKASLRHVLTYDEKKTLFRALRKTLSTPSRLPRIVPEYSQLKLPVIEKKYRSDYGKSRIPTISPDNEVFCSPDRRSNAKASATGFPRSVPNSNTSAHSSVENQSAVGQSDSVAQHKTHAEAGYSDLCDEGGMNVARRPSVNAPANKVSLNVLKTPDLVYANDAEIDLVSPVSWRSTSPGRPTSSMGSRYDERNLTPPLRHLKKRWK